MKNIKLNEEQVNLLKICLEVIRDSADRGDLEDITSQADDIMESIYNDTLEDCIKALKAN